MVDEGTVVNAGQPIFRLLESARLEARIGIPASVLGTLTEGTIYQVEVRGELYPAVLSQVLSEVDSETRTATAIFLVEAPFSRVRSGELARVSLTQTINEAGYWVPIEALTGWTQAPVPHPAHGYWRGQRQAVPAPPAG